MLKLKSKNYIKNIEDSEQQVKFAEAADLQNKLFTEAEKYSKESEEWDNKARDYAKLL